MIIVVLNDGTTYTDIAGCKIVWIDDSFDGNEDIEELLKDLNKATSRGMAEVMVNLS